MEKFSFVPQQGQANINTVWHANVWDREGEYITSCVIVDFHRFLSFTRALDSSSFRNVSLYPELGWLIGSLT